MKLFLQIILLINSIFTFGQVPTILWQKSFGGSMDEEGFSIVANPNGDIVTVGYSSSNNGDIIDHYGFIGSPDFWLIKTDYLGNLIWSKNYGGTLGDNAHSIQRTKNGGYIIYGETTSDTINRFHANSIYSDVLITKIDSNGNFEWQNCYGSYYMDKGIQIKETIDSGFVFLAEISNGGGDVSNFIGQLDFWVVKINSLGNIEWDKTLGGTLMDSPKSLTILTDGNILVTGVNGSHDGTITCSNVGYSCWITKLNSNGIILWDKCYGGTAPEVGFGIIESSNSGFYVCSTTDSNDGDVIGHIGSSDIWIFKADSSGTIEWSRCFGGIASDRPHSISKTSNGGVIVSGRTNSNQAHPLWNDIIVVKVDSLGVLEWQGYFGGSGHDEGYDAVETSDNNFVVTGFTESNDGDLTFNHGGKDLWLVKLESPVAVKNVTLPTVEINAMNENGSLLITINSTINDRLKLNLYDIVGRLVTSKELECKIGKTEFRMDNNIAKGLYILKTNFKNGQISKKIY
jgi:hypothetical protein